MALVEPGDAPEVWELTTKPQPAPSRSISLWAASRPPPGREHDVAQHQHVGIQGVFGGGEAGGVDLGGRLDFACHTYCNSL